MFYEKGVANQPRNAGGEGEVYFASGAVGENCSGKKRGVEGEGGFEVSGEIGPIVAAGIKMEFVGDFAGGEDFVESGGAGFEAEIVFGAAIEINFHAGERRRAGKNERAVAPPEGRIGRLAENAAEEAGTASSGRVVVSGEESGKFLDEGRTVGADGGEQFGMMEGEMERAVAAHGNAGDGAIGAAGTYAIEAFDERKKFLQEKILVAGFAVPGIDVEAGRAGGSGDKEILEAPFFAEILDEIPGAGAEEGLLIVAEAVEEIEDGEAAGLVGVKAGRQENAVWNRARKNFAGDGVAFGAAGGGGGAREVEEVEEVKEVKDKKKADPSLRSG
jgi:hypothetical protein